MDDTIGGDLVRPLADLLKAHAANSGSKVAYTCGRASVTSAELERGTARLAGRLAALGLRRGDRVLICLRSGIEAVQAVLAATRAAAVGVPVDPRSSTADLRRFFAGSRPRVVIADPPQLPHWSEVLAGSPGVHLVAAGSEPLPAGLRAGTLRLAALAGDGWASAAGTGTCGRCRCSTRWGTVIA
jgi:acyl-CoA synthetase (AMP-forming)/AMP-acid ligase II